MCLYAQIDCSAKYLLGRTERTYMLKGNTLVFRYIKRHGVGTEYCACKYVIDRVLITGSHFFIYECMFTQLWKYAYQKFAWDAKGGNIQKTRDRLHCCVISQQPDKSLQGI